MTARKAKAKAKATATANTGVLRIALRAQAQDDGEKQTTAKAPAKATATARATATKGLFHCLASVALLGRFLAAQTDPLLSNWWELGVCLQEGAHHIEDERKLLGQGCVLTDR
jgi:hypothetical protein